MDINERMQKAIQFSQQATELDKNKEYEEALKIYKIALDNWRIVYKYQNNESLKKRLYVVINDYVSRAEDIKKYLNETKNKNSLHGKKTVIEGYASSSNKSCVSDGCEDSAESKMKDKLESAIITEKPNVSWSDIAGLESAKDALQEAVILPTRFPNLFTGERKPWRGILLYGPPGTGKTYLAKACASEADATFLSVSSADLLSKWQGESEKLVRTLFEMSRERKPAIIFIDEVDSMCSARSESDSESTRRIKTEFLVQMQGIGKDDSGVLVLAATNVPWQLDSAIRRRFERRVYIPLPCKDARREMFCLGLMNTSHELTDADFDELSVKTEGFSGADISIVIRDALFQSVRKCRMASHFKEVMKNGVLYTTPCSPEDDDPSKKEMNLMSVNPESLLPPELCMSDFLVVLSNTRPSVAIEDLSRYVRWTEQFGVEGN